MSDARARVITAERVRRQHFSADRFSITHAAKAKRWRKLTHKLGAIFFALSFARHVPFLCIRIVQQIYNAWAELN
jgi:hypothetical protein